MRDDRLQRFERLPLRAHSLFSGVPLHDLWAIELPGGRDAMTMADINAIVGVAGGSDMRVGPLTQALFALRTLVGRLLGWDDAPDLDAKVSYVERLTAEDRAASRLEPGNRHGIIRDLYLFDREYAGEIVNRTVHAVVVVAAERTPGGYRLFVAIYVARVSWFTPVYLALITLPCQWIIYPSMRQGIRHRWREAFGSGAARGNAVCSS